MFLDFKVIKKALLYGTKKVILNLKVEKMINWQDFEKVDMPVGTIIRCK